MRRCWLKGSEGNALHAVLCAAGFTSAGCCGLSSAWACGSFACSSRPCGYAWLHCSSGSPARRRVTTNCGLSGLGEFCEADNGSTRFPCF